MLLSIEILSFYFSTRWRDDKGTKRIRVSAQKVECTAIACLDLPSYNCTQMVVPCKDIFISQVAHNRLGSTNSKVPSMTILSQCDIYPYTHSLCRLSQFVYRKQEECNVCQNDLSFAGPKISFVCSSSRSVCTCRDTVIPVRMNKLGFHHAGYSTLSVMVC